MNRDEKAEREAFLAKAKLASNRLDTTVEASRPEDPKSPTPLRGGDEKVQRGSSGKKERRP